MAGGMNYCWRAGRMRDGWREMSWRVNSKLHSARDSIKYQNLCCNSKQSDISTFKFSPRVDLGKS